MWRADSGDGSDPPAIPSDSPGAARGGTPRATIVARVVVGVLVALLVIVFVVMRPKLLEPQRQTVCASNLSQLCALYIVEAQENPETARRWSGSALWLAMRKDGLKVGRGQESALLCPGDGSVDRPPSPGQISAWDQVNLDAPPRELCSYAGRDFANFPIDAASGLPQAIGACVHHRGGAIVVFDNGSVQKMGREQLGLAPHDDIVCGPESKSPLLRMLVGGN